MIFTENGKGQANLSGMNAGQARFARPYILSEVDIKLNTDRLKNHLDSGTEDENLIQ